ncbi:MAG: hypothetical protein AAGI30_00120 [Planctomycetota bacterium]
MTTLTTPETQIDDRVADATRQLKSAFSELIAALPETIDRPVGIERALGLNNKLAWQVHRAAFAEPAITAGVSAPGLAATRSVIKAAKARGVPDGVLARLETAAIRFHDEVPRHADTRSSLEIMIRSVTGEGLSDHERDLKRIAYRANRELIGRCCDLTLACLIVMPAATDGRVDLAVIRGHMNLYRLRSGVPLQVNRSKFADLQLRPLAGDQLAPHDASNVIENMILEEFSSDPLPPIHHDHHGDGFVRSYADPDQLGLNHAFTCFLWSEIRNVEFQDLFNSMVEVSTPTKLLVQDCLIPLSLVDGRMPELRIPEKQSDALAWPGDKRAMVLPIRERVELLGVGTNCLATPGLPRYAEMVHSVARRLGWDAEELGVYRAKIEHPVLHSVSWMRFKSSENES